MSVGVDRRSHPHPPTQPTPHSYTPEAFAIFDEIEKQATGSPSSTTLGPVARERALVLATALQSTAAAAPALQQALLAQLVQVRMVGLLMPRLIMCRQPSPSP